MTVDQALTNRFLERATAKGLVDVAVTTMDSPIGTLLLMATPKGLVRIAFESENRDEVLGEVAMHISPRILEAPRRLDPVRRELDKYFEGRLRDFDVPLDWSLVGDFARKVLRRTARIPYGSVASYGEVAVDVGTPRGCAGRRQCARVQSDPGDRAVPPGASAPAARSAATAAGCRVSACSWTSRPAEPLPAGRRLGPVEEPDEVLGARHRLPAPREEVLGDHPVVCQRGHRHRPLIERPGDLDLVGGGFVAHDDTAGRRTASTVVASRGRHSHRKRPPIQSRQAYASPPQPLSPKWVPQSERVSWPPLSRCTGSSGSSCRGAPPATRSRPIPGLARLVRGASR